MRSDVNTDAIRVEDSQVRVVMGAGRVGELGNLARDQGASRVLLVTDPGIVATGHAHRAEACLRQAGLKVAVFHEVDENPTTEHVARGVQAAKQHNADFLVGLGGGSAIDCAKGINFLYTNGGRMQDYWGINKAKQPMLPMIAVPTTAGTGTEAQSFALITDPATHQKMACGDAKAVCRIAILDPELTATAPPSVAATTGIDAISHAVETSASTKRNPDSRALSVRAWELLESAYEAAVGDQAGADVRLRMLAGAFLAGAAIERSMLGAAHACANPLTAMFGIVHGTAVGMMLPHVVRFNVRHAPDAYADLCQDPQRLITRIEAFLDRGRLPRRLTDCGVSAEALPELARLAATQWTARFNPCQVGEVELLEIYRAAM